MQTIPVEICIDCSDPEEAVLSARNAVLGGADRLELCSNMHHGGLTPHLEIVKRILDATNGKAELLAMIRPRPGDFEYAPDELSTMQQSIERFADVEIDGVVLGAITARRVYQEATIELTKAAHNRNLRVTFHRAFDALSDWQLGLDTLIQARVDRILTSGTPWNDPTARLFDGKKLSEIVHRAQGKVELVLAGGVSDSNVSELLPYVTTNPSAPVSIHAYSSVRLNGITDINRVASLVASVRRFSRTT